jgi:universal stress protein F
MKTIVVGLDTAPGAEIVLRRALELAEATAARLFVVHAVFVPPQLPSTLFQISQAELFERIVSDARKTVEALVSKVPRARLAGTSIIVGVAWREICEAAQEYDAATIVIGAHAHGALDRMLGTTAAKVVNHAQRDVLVVKL